MPRACPVACVKDFRQLRQELQVYRSEWRRSRTPSGVQGVRRCWWPWSSRTACTPDGVRVSLVPRAIHLATPDGVRGGCYNRLKMSLATNVKHHGAKPVASLAHAAVQVAASVKLYGAALGILQLSGDLTLCRYSGEAGDNHNQLRQLNWLG